MRLPTLLHERVAILDAGIGRHTRSDEAPLFAISVLSVSRLAFVAKRGQALGEIFAAGMALDGCNLRLKAVIGVGVEMGAPGP
jgi:hypothetical protein